MAIMNMKLILKDIVSHAMMDVNYAMGLVSKSVQNVIKTALEIIIINGLDKILVKYIAQIVITKFLLTFLV